MTNRSPQNAGFGRFFYTLVGPLNWNELMGLDLYGIFQKCVADHWEDIDCARHFDRNYDLFGWLSFGGDNSGSCQFEPLARARGFPEDFKCVPGELYAMANGEQCLLGEGGYSWLLGSEILQATPPNLTRIVIATPAAIEFYDDPDYPPWRVAANHFFYRDPGHPISICSIGENVEIAGAVWDFDFAEYPDIPRKSIAVSERVVYQWRYDFSLEFRNFIEEVRRQVDLYGEVRFVFGFG